MHTNIDPKKIRVIVSPRMPKLIPYTIPMNTVQELVVNIQPFLKPVLYAGWGRRDRNGKKELVYLLATGETVAEARNAFRSSDLYGEIVWCI